MASFFKEIAGNKDNLVFIYGYLKKYKKYSFITLSLTILGIIFWTFEPYILKILIDTLETIAKTQLQGTAALKKVSGIFALLIFFQVGDVLLFEGGIYFLTFLQINLMRDVSVAAYKKVQQLSYRFFVNKQAGSLAGTISRGVESINGLTDSAYFTLIPLLLRLPLNTILIFFVQGSIAYLFIFLFVSFIWQAIKIAEKMQKGEYLEGRQSDKTAGLRVDSLINFEAVKSFFKQHFMLQKIQSSENSLYRLRQKIWTSYPRHFSRLDLSFVGAVALIYAFAIYKFILGQYALSDFIMLTSIIAAVTQQLYQFSGTYMRVRRNLTNMIDLGKLLKQKPEIEEKDHAVMLPPFHKEIVFDRVTFGYQKGQPVLNKVTFTVPKGKKVALVGHSGSGKSTLIKLLLRFYDVQKGKILIDGHDLRDLKLDYLTQTSLVPQDPVMFHDTIKNNILFSLPKASFEEVQAAAKQAHAHDFILKLPKKYDTLVGERGIKLSGGERQRVAIARAFLANTPIILLDEATSSLDSASEKKIQEALQDLTQGKTTITVAHRLSTIKNSDIIVILDKGLFIDIGKHEELLRRCPLYQNLWSLQVGGFIGS